MQGSRLGVCLKRTLVAAVSKAAQAKGGFGGNCGQPRTYAHSTSCLGQGFGPHYPWVSSLAAGVQSASKENKPLLLIIHKSWCGTCIDLAYKVARCPEMIRLSNHFVMVNLIDDQEPRDNRFMPDGGYTPRILFISPKGEIRTDIYNKTGLEKFKFFYPDPSDVVQSMREALKRMSPEAYKEAIRDEGKMGSCY